MSHYQLIFFSEYHEHIHKCKFVAVELAWCTFLCVLVAMLHPGATSSKLEVQRSTVVL